MYLSTASLGFSRSEPLSSGSGHLAFDRRHSHLDQARDADRITQWYSLPTPSVPQLLAVAQGREHLLMEALDASSTCSEVEEDATRPRQQFLQSHDDRPASSVLLRLGSIVCVSRPQEPQKRNNSA